jgi:ProP effector
MSAASRHGGVDEMAVSERQARAQAAVAHLREHFPAIFTPASCRPIKIGIHNELVALGFDREMVGVGLRSYCGSSAYVSALREGAARIGLDGQPAGVVNAQKEKSAAAQLAEKIDRAKNRPSLAVTGAYWLDPRIAPTEIQPT